MAFELQVEAREQSSRAGNRRLRRSGRIPAIIYGGGQEPSPISLDNNSLLHEMDRGGFYTSILTVKIGKDEQSVVVKEVQRHPVRPQILHLDFQRVVEDKPITLNVPIRFVNEDLAIGVTEEGGVVEHIETDVEITCLPRYLPEFIELDVSALALNQLYHLSDIKFPEGVTSVALEHDQDPAIVAVNPPRREEIDEVPEVELAEGEIPPDEVPAGEEGEEGEAKAEDEGEEDKSGD